MRHGLAARSCACISQATVSRSTASARVSSCSAKDNRRAGHCGAEARQAPRIEAGTIQRGPRGAGVHLLVARADQSGLDRLTACVLDSQAWLLPVLGRYGTCEAWLRQGVFEVTVHRELGSGRETFL